MYIKHVSCVTNRWSSWAHLVHCIKNNYLIARNCCFTTFFSLKFFSRSDGRLMADARWWDWFGGPIRNNTTNYFIISSSHLLLNIKPCVSSKLSTEHQYHNSVYMWYECVTLHDYYLFIYVSIIIDGAT